jgi:hypothetical protein
VYPVRQTESTWLRQRLQAGTQDARLRPLDAFAARGDDQARTSLTEAGASRDDDRSGGRVTEGEIATAARADPLRALTLTPERIEVIGHSRTGETRWVNRLDVRFWSWQVVA